MNIFKKFCSAGSQTIFPFKYSVIKKENALIITIHMTIMKTKGINSVKLFVTLKLPTKLDIT